MNETTTECPYCFAEINAAATRCPHCAGQRFKCWKCQQLQPIVEKKHFVGLLRGGTKTYNHCRVCGTRV